MNGTFDQLFLIYFLIFFFEKKSLGFLIIPKIK